MTKLDVQRDVEVKVRRPYIAPKVEIVLKHQDTRNNPGVGFDGGVSDNLS